MCLGLVYKDKKMSNKKIYQSNDKLPNFLSFDFSQHQIYPEFKFNNQAFYDYYLALANIIPCNFESYAICLHPIGYYQDGNYTEPKANTRKSLFQAFEISVNYEMNLNNLYHLEKELFQKHSLSLYTSNGDSSNIQFDFIIDILKTLVNNDIYYYYDILKIISYSEYDYNNLSELLFKGEILVHQELQQHSKIQTQPTALFDDSETWGIVTDYDLPYTFIAGNKSFVDCFLKAEYDIYPITPKYQWIKKNE